jgi:glutaminyl-tRNA synthetase
VVKDANGEVVEIHATYDPATRGGDSPDGRKVKSTIHWLSAEHAVPAEFRMYDRLFTKPDPDAGEEDFLNYINPDSIRIVEGYVEPSLADTKPGDRFQFERLGYFCTDLESTPEHLVFNLTVTLRDSWAKIEQKSK